MSHAAAIIAEHFAIKKGHLTIGGVSVVDLAERFATPFFVYHQATLESVWQRTRDAFEGVDLHYSVKANPAAEILRFFVHQGAGLEVASAGELEAALQADAAADRILFAGPGKSDAELELAVDCGVGEIHIESLGEAERLNRIAARQAKVATVAIRVNPGASAAGGAVRMGGKPSPFGIDEEILESVASSIASMQSLNLAGVHIYAGSQILDAEVLLAQYSHAFELAQRLAQTLGAPIRTIDLGGGLGVPYFEGESALDLAAVGSRLAELVAEARRQPLLADSRLILEPGRLLVAEAGVYVTRVIDVKSSRGKRFAVLDGGMNHHLAASGNLGQVVKRNFPIAVANRLDAESSMETDLVGPLCTPLDVIGRKVALPELDEGDLIAILQSGAYARSASPARFLSRPEAIEIMIADGQARRLAST